MKVLLVGCGKMGGALLTQWVKDDAAEFTVIDPYAKDIAQGAKLVSSTDDLKTGSFDLIIIAIKPQMIGDIMPGYKPYLTEHGFVASIAAGSSIARIKSVMDGRPVVRIMPNLPALIGQSVSGMVADGTVTNDQKSAIDRLMAHAGTTIWVDSEDQIDRVTAVAGSGPGYVFEILRTMIEAAEGLDFTHDQARDLVLGTFAGTLKMAMDTGRDLEELRNSVTSKAGTTEAGLKALNGQGELSHLARNTVNAAYTRAIELR